MTDAVAWDDVAAEVDWACGDPARLARALQAMGLSLQMVLRRGDFPTWPPAFRRFIPWRRRLESCPSLAARGWRAGAWSAAAVAAMDAQDASRRETAAAWNRCLRDSEVMVLGAVSVAEARGMRAARAKAREDWRKALRDWRPKAGSAPSAGAKPRYHDLLADRAALPEHLILLDLAVFDWRYESGAAEGCGIAELAAFVWNCGRGRAIASLARLLGVPLLTQGALRRAGVEVAPRG